MSIKRCHSCLKRGKYSAVYSACYECQEFYCKTCSDIHPTFQPTADHTIYKLHLPEITGNEDKLASGVQKKDDNDPPYAHQVTVHSPKGENEKKNVTFSKSHKKLPNQAHVGALEANYCRDINAERSEDEYGVNVTGMLAVAGKVILVDYTNELLKMFDERGTYLSSTTLKAYTWGITLVSNDTFATCGDGKKVYKWHMQEQSITCSDVTYHVDHNASDIKYNGTYYCLLHRWHNTITILDKKGKHVRHIKIKKAFKRKIISGCGIHMDNKSHNIYVPCRGSSRGVLCVSVEGGPLWFTSMSLELWGITEIRGVLCVADRIGRCLHLLSKAGTYGRKLLDEKELNGAPDNIYYDDQADKLYISFDDPDDVISTYFVGC